MIDNRYGLVWNIVIVVLAIILFPITWLCYGIRWWWDV